MSDRIAVLGAGPMGLAVAWQLVQQGYRPVLFEADDRVGGMAASFDFDGLTIERYYHFHCTSDRHLLETLDELGIPEAMQWVETRMGYWYQGRVQDWGDPLALLRFRGLGMFSKIRYGAHAFLSTKRRDWRPLDRVEASGWLRRWAGDEAFEVLWRTLFDYKFYHYADNLSAAWIWSRIRRIGRSRYSLMREKLGYLKGGSETVLLAMKAAIEAGGGEIRLNCPVRRVVIQGEQVKGLETAGEAEGGEARDGEARGGTDAEAGSRTPVFEEFDRVISTVPLPYLPRLMPDLPAGILDQYKSVNNIAVVCVIVRLRKAVSDKFWLNINDPDMDIPGLVEYSNLRPLDDHVVYVPFYMPGEHPKFQEPDQHFLDRVRCYLKQINPALCDEDFIAIRASRYRFAQPVCEPGFLEKLPPVALPVKGLWAADTSYYYPDDRGISESIQFGRQMARQACD